jgi:hypothetical protein
MRRRASASWCSWLPAYLFERVGRVATFTGLPERAPMGIVLPVAGVAIGGQCDLGDIPSDVAGVAIETAVCTSQWVTRLCVVIEAP